MNEIFAKAIRFGFAAAMLTAPSLGVAAAQTVSGEQCSLAIVSKFADKSQKVCDTKIVRELAEQGHAFEQNQLGIASMLSIGPEYTDKEALKWFEKAAWKDYAPAQVNLAVMYANGWGTPANYGAALNWFHVAAAQKFPRAYTNLGILYLKGQGVHQDYNEAFRWFEMGANAGDSDGQTNLAYMYANGFGCAKNEGSAAAWYRKAADAENPLAENSLADMYLRGDGVQQNAAEAFRLFQKAAEQGHTGARIMLGSMFAEGLGTKKDPEAAYLWITAATMGGDQRGRDRLQVLEARLTPAQISAARDRAGQLQFNTGQQLTVRAMAK